MKMLKAKKKEKSASLCGCLLRAGERSVPMSIRRGLTTYKYKHINLGRRAA
jgi:hypothetical protein